MKANSNFEVRNIGGIDILVPTGGDMSLSSVITLNESALFIWNCLQTETTEEEIIEKMLAEYDAERSVIEADVKEIIAKLKESKLVD